MHPNAVYDYFPTWHEGMGRIEIPDDPLYPCAKCGVPVARSHHQLHAEWHENLASWVNSVTKVTRTFADEMRSI